MLTSFGKKVEVFLFYLVKRDLNGGWDCTVQRYFTVKNGENEHKKVRMNDRKERSFLLGVIEGILFLSQKREYPLTFTNFEARLHSWADLFRKTVLKPCGFIKFWTQNSFQMQACLQNRLKPTWFKNFEAKLHLNTGSACKYGEFTMWTNEVFNVS